MITRIVDCSDQKTRTLAVTKLIGAGAKLAQLRNYTGVMQVQKTTKKKKRPQSFDFLDRLFLRCLVLPWQDFGKRGLLFQSKQQRR